MVFYCNFRHFIKSKQIISSEFLITTIERKDDGSSLTCQLMDSNIIAKRSKSKISIRGLDTPRPHGNNYRNKIPYPTFDESYTKIYPAVTNMKGLVFCRAKGCHCWKGYMNEGCKKGKISKLVKSVKNSTCIC
jgi:hypothetical protein